MAARDELLRLGERTTRLANLAREAAEPLDDQKLEEGFAQLRERRDPRNARLTRGRIAFACALTAAATFVLFARASWIRIHPAALSYQILGAEIEQEGYLRSVPGAHPTLTFSDG